jgi:hypothetical protein
LTFFFFSVTLKFSFFCCTQFIFPVGILLLDSFIDWNSQNCIDAETWFCAKVDWLMDSWYLCLPDSILIQCEQRADCSWDW